MNLYQAKDRDGNNVALFNFEVLPKDIDIDELWTQYYTDDGIDEYGKQDLSFQEFYEGDFNEYLKIEHKIDLGIERVFPLEINII